MLSAHWHCGSVQYRLRDITPFSFSIYILEVGGWLDSKLSLQYHIVQPFTWYNSSDMVASVRFIYFSRLSLAAYQMWMGVPSSRYFAGFAGKYVFLLSSVHPSLASAGAEVFAMVFFNCCEAHLRLSLYRPMYFPSFNSREFSGRALCRIWYTCRERYLAITDIALYVRVTETLLQLGTWT